MTISRILQAIAILLFLIGIYKGYMDLSSENPAIMSLREHQPIQFFLGISWPFIGSLGALILSRRTKKDKS